MSETIVIRLGDRFQSTLPAGGATQASRALHQITSYFNPRSPRGERPKQYAEVTAEKDFNPRSPRGERPNN